MYGKLIDALTNVWLYINAFKVFVNEDKGQGQKTKEQACETLLCLL